MGLPAVLPYLPLKLSRVMQEQTVEIRNSGKALEHNIPGVALSGKSVSQLNLVGAKGFESIYVYQECHNVDIDLNYY